MSGFERLRDRLVSLAKPVYGLARRREGLELIQTLHLLHNLIYFGRRASRFEIRPCRLHPLGVGHGDAQCVHHCLLDGTTLAQEERYQNVVDVLGRQRWEPRALVVPQEMVQCARTTACGIVRGRRCKQLAHRMQHVVRLV
eukprot:scaffold18321_cov28-Tisochrysis_lutea.AAC.2